jgi:hypothetical protein
VDQIGTSYISTVDLVICGIALALFRWLAFPPKNAKLSVAIALASAGAVVAIGAVLFLVDLNRGAVGELSMIALGLCFTLGHWHDKRKKHASPAAPSASSKQPLQG